MELLQASQHPSAPSSVTNLEQDEVNSDCTRLSVTPDVNLDKLLAISDTLEQIYIEFPQAGDGRGFSIAKTLRLQGYTGRLIAIGHVTLDRLSYMKRVGFDTVVVSDNTDQTRLEQVLKQISVTYQ